MTSDVAAPASETTAANGHGEAHSTAGLKALLIGSIGVVYGDIGTSPLYALREAVVAASNGGEVTSFAVTDVTSSPRCTRVRVSVAARAAGSAPIP